MPIRRLDPVLVDRIAAGEVIERPAAAVKELVENALDAGAKRIDVTIEAGGRRLIRVSDDGSGMTAEDLALAVERHATSKLPDEDLFAISTFGFRGEALPSIAAVSRLEIVSRHDGGRHGACDSSSRRAPCRGFAPPRGRKAPRVEVRDLFSAMPARLKFLKSDRTEARLRGRGLETPRARSLRRAHHAFGRRRSGSRLWTARRRRGGSGPQGRRGAGPRIPRQQRARSSRRARACRSRGFAGLPTYTRGERLGDPSFRQWAPGARQADRSARCAAPMRISCPQGVIRRSRSISRSIRAPST